MPRYFFHVQSDDYSTRDEEGTELPSLAEACRQARRMIGEVIAEQLAGRESAIYVSVRIEDRVGTRAANITAVTGVFSSEDPTDELRFSNRSSSAAARRMSDEMRKSGVLPAANED